jgi:hypothetical protein
MAQVTNPTDSTYFNRLENTLSLAKSSSSLYKAIVNAPFNSKINVTKLGLGIIVLLLVNESKQVIERTALSTTYHAAGAVKASEKPFKAIKIPLHYPDNLIAKAIDTGKPQATSDWQYLFVPVLTKEQARYNQDGASIACSEVWPLSAGSGGALIFSYYNPAPLKERREFMQQYVELVNNHLS